ncbi:hypothetical protein PINS_up008771 [Pythium insidiosum]|nr:hypothetical protein PINS_up008771 [Pythium insidiosum]
MEDEALASPREHRESIVLDPEEIIDSLESKMFQLAQDVATTEMPDEELTTKLNMIAETLEDVETSFRKERTAPYRRDGHLIGNLLQILEQQDEFYSVLESKLSELTDPRVKAAACRLLLATVPVNSRFIVRMLYEEEILERMCEYATDTDPPLRCYATGLLAIGLRDRSVADIVVNKETSLKFLKRMRLYASKLETERQAAVKYMQEHIRSASSSKQRRGAAPSSTNGIARVTSTPARPDRGQKRRFAELSTTRSNSQDSHRSNDRETSSDGLGTSSQPDLSESSQAAPSADDQLPAGDQSRIVGDTELLAFEPDPDRHEEDLQKLVMLELLYTLDCIGLMGEYLELFAPALKEDIVGSIVTFLHSKNPTVLSHTMKLTSHFLAHKKFCFSLIDVGGVDLIFATAKTHNSSGQPGLLDRSLSMCLHGLASSSVVIERILAVDSEALLSASFALLSSPNDRARQNAVVFFGLTLCFKVVLDYFEKSDGLYTLLNIIRAGNNPKSAVQRQLSHDACLCLRQYLRVHMALVTHRLRRRLAQLNSSANRNSTSAPLLTAAPALARLPARVPKLSASKPVDIDDKTHEQNLIFFEKYRFSVPSGTGSSGPWSAAVGSSGAMWPPAATLHHLRGTLVMLEVIAMMATMVQNGDPDENSSSTRVWIVERAQFCLEGLRVLTLVVPALANEVCSTEVAVDESISNKRAGMSVLLEIAMSTNARDSDLVRDALYVFCNCVSPPHSEDCWQHPHKDIRQYTLTARDMRKRAGDCTSNGQAPASQADEDNCQICCQRVRDDKPLRPVRKLAREKNAIKVCIQLLRYKRSVQNADAIRLLATRALLGLSRDRHIAQILERMQIGQVLSDLIRLDPVLEENADLHVRFRENALDLISQVTHRASNAVINEAADPTVRKIEKASIVAQTAITYDQSELLKLIHDHLVAKGLQESAATLLRESKLLKPEEPQGNLSNQHERQGILRRGTSTEAFSSGDEQYLWLGNHEGQIQKVGIESDSIVEEWVCHSASSAVVDLETNETTRLGLANRSLLTGTVALTTFGSSEIALWDANSMQSARWRFEGGYKPRYNHYGDRVVALDARLDEESIELGSTSHVSGAVMIDVATGSVMCELKDSLQSNDYNRETNCCFSPDDGAILTGGMLWDARVSTRALYKFDKLSNFGYGYFHPNGNEIIINSAIWDLRTYQLLRVVPALDKCLITFNSSGGVMFAYSPHSVVDDMERRRPKAKTWFRVLDARDYKDISTIELERPIYGISVDPNNLLLSVIEGRYRDAESSTEDDTVCRLYEIGRKRPSEDDSDIEDANDDDMEDDEFVDASGSEDEEDEDGFEDEIDEDDEDDGDGEDEYDMFHGHDFDELDYDVDEMGEGESEYAPGDGDDEDQDGSDQDDASDASGLSGRARVRGHGFPLSARNIQFLLQLPDTAYYEVHDQYSTDEEEEEDREDDP